MSTDEVLCQVRLRARYGAWAAAVALVWTLGTLVVFVKVLIDLAAIDAGSALIPPAMVTVIEQVPTMLAFVEVVSAIACVWLMVVLAVFADPSGFDPASLPERITGVGVGTHLLGHFVAFVAMLSGVQALVCVSAIVGVLGAVTPVSVTVFGVAAIILSAILAFVAWCSSNISARFAGVATDVAQTPFLS